jgi:hypothetical protein
MVKICYHAMDAGILRTRSACFLFLTFLYYFWIVDGASINLMILSYFRSSFRPVLSQGGRLLTSLHGVTFGVLSETLKGLELQRESYVLLFLLNLQ